MTSNVEMGAPRAVVVGVGLIGGSIALALRQRGWHVSGIDSDPDVLQRALQQGVIDDIGDDPRADFGLVATPAGGVVAAVRALLASHPAEDFLISDVAGVKASICRDITDPRFIGGHPMAGSEHVGLSGARPDLFVGATWVLTPGAHTSTDLYTRLAGIVRDFGAQALSLRPEDHDRLVAHISHVPHLVAASLMNEAAATAKDDAALLQLAAGGFRDMTRIAAGHPGIWPDVCVENREAILSALDSLAAQVSFVRQALLQEDKDSIFELLETASRARRALPGRSAHPEQLAQVRIPVPDQAGVIALVTGAASELGVSIFDVEIAHSAEGARGVLIVVVATDDADRYSESLQARGFSCSVQDL